MHALCVIPQVLFPASDKRTSVKLFKLPTPPPRAVTPQADCLCLSGCRILLHALLNYKFILIFWTLEGTANFNTSTYLRYLTQTWNT